MLAKYSCPIMLIVSTLKSQKDQSSMTMLIKTYLIIMVACVKRNYEFLFQDIHEIILHLDMNNLGLQLAL